MPRGGQPLSVPAAEPDGPLVPDVNPEGICVREAVRGLEDFDAIVDPAMHAGKARDTPKFACGWLLRGAAHPNLPHGRLRCNWVGAHAGDVGAAAGHRSP